MRIVLFSIPALLCLLGLADVIRKPVNIQGKVIFIGLFGLLLIVSALLMAGIPQQIIEGVFHG